MLGSNCSPCCQPASTGEICDAVFPQKLKIAYYVIPGYDGSYAAGPGTSSFEGFPAGQLLYVESLTRNIITSAYSDYGFDAGPRVRASGFIEEVKTGTTFNITSTAYRRTAEISANILFRVGRGLGVTFKNECVYDRRAGGSVIANHLKSMIFLSPAPQPEDDPGTTYGGFGFTTAQNVFGSSIESGTTQATTYALSPNTFPITVHAKGIGWGMNGGAYAYWELKVEIHGVFDSDLNPVMMGPLGGLNANLP